MSRTIGKYHESQVKRLVREANKEGIIDTYTYVKERMPIEAYDSWEGSYDEIMNLIGEAIMEG